MKYEITESSSSSLSSSCTSDGNVLDVNHPNYKKSLLSSSRKAKSRKAKGSSELEPNSSEEDGSSSSVCNTGSFIQEEKQVPHTHSVPLKAEWPPENTADALESRAPKEAFEKRAAWATKQAASPMDKEVPLLPRQEPITLVKSNSVSATRADNILKLDYITASSNSYHAYNHKFIMQGHRLSTGDSPLHMQKRHGSQGPASLRTGFPSPGTPSRSSFSGVPTSLMVTNKAYHNNMVGRIAVTEGNGKLLPLYNLPPCSDQADANINPGRLSVGFSSRAHAAPPPSKWDDAEKWLVNASPSHPSQPPTPSLPCSKQAANYTTNPGNNTNLSSRSTQAVDHHLKMAATYNTHTLKDQSSFATMSMHENYIESRALVPLASSSSDGQMHEDGGGGGAMSDSELSNAQEECKSAFVRSTSHRQSDSNKHRNYMKKLGQPGRKSSGLVSKEELLISSPVSLQLERLKLGYSTPHPDHQQLPQMHDVYAVETTTKVRNVGLCADEAPRGEIEVAGSRADNGGGSGSSSSSMTRLVVQAGKVVGRWGAGAMRDASTDVSPKMSMSRRDMGTQMTPVASSKTSRATTPRKSSSPVRHNTPTVGDNSAATCETRCPVGMKAGATCGEYVGDAKVGRVQVGCPGGSNFSVSTGSHEGSSSSSWKSLQESLLHMGAANSSQSCSAAVDQQQQLMMMMKVDQQLSSSSLKSAQDMESSQLQQLKPHDVHLANGPASAQYSAWEDAERSKHMTKCAREEARIDAWESHQKAKAEAELKKLEMKLERLRAQATEKIMNKMAASHLRAEEMRAAARAHQAEQLAKALERANSLSKRGSGYFSESLGVCFSIMP